MIKAVLFDLDDTLFDHEHCARTALDAVRSSHDCFRAMDPHVLNATHARILEELHPEVLSGRMELNVSRVERFRRLFRAAGVDPEPDMLEMTAANYRRSYVGARRPMQDAAALLAAVRTRAQVGIVSNNLLEEQQEKLRHCELNGFVDVLIVSAEAGVSKPDPLIFRLALERLDCKPEAAVMVGDSWSADIVGALAAGIRPVWFNRWRVAKPETPDGVAMIDSLSPTPRVLAAIFGN